MCRISFWRLVISLSLFFYIFFPILNLFGFFFQAMSKFQYVFFKLLISGYYGMQIMAMVFNIIPFIVGKYLLGKSHICHILHILSQHMIEEVWKTYFIHFLKLIINVFLKVKMPFENIAVIYIIMP